MRKIKVQGLFVVATLTLCMVVVSAHAQTYSDLYNFGDASGDPLNPQYSGIIARVMATFTARLRQAEARGLGTVFNITAQGAMSVLYNFDGTHGKFPYGGLTLGTDGNFYGTTSVGGSTNLGVIFKITRAGALTVLHTFASGDGITPYAPPIQAADGNFYGTTAFGGASGYGAVYKIMPTGAYTVPH